MGSRQGRNDRVGMAIVILGSFQRITPFWGPMNVLPAEPLPGHGVLSSAWAMVARKLASA